MIVYASLYPFVGWRVPGVGPLDFLVLGWPRYWTSFDFVANLLGYLPLGFLLFVAVVRSGRRAREAALLACAGGALLSLTMEIVQNYLPHRVSSNVDLALNAAGTAMGVAIGALLHWRGGIAQWQKLRDRWFVARSAGGLALLVLWPIGLLFPTAVPFGLGHVLGRIQPLVVELLAGTPAASWTEGWAVAVAPAVEAAAPALTSTTELSIIVLGLLAPCLVAFTIATPGWRRAALVIGAAVIGAATTTLSTALNFGPTHAFSWTTQQALQALAIGTGAAMLLSLVPRPGRRRLRPDRAHRAGDAGRARTRRPVLRAKPARLGAGPLHPLPRRGPVGRLAVALRGADLPAGPPGGARAATVTQRSASEAEQLQRQSMRSRRRLGELVQHVHVMAPGHLLA